MRSWNDVSRIAVLAVSLSFAAACGGGDDGGNGDPTGPGEPIGTYAQQAASVRDVADRFFVENEAVTSLSAVSELIRAAGFGAALAGSSGEGTLSIPANLKGTVWVLQESPLEYVQDTGQSGPADGVRFVLYDIELATGLPSTPLEAVGHVDIVETGADPEDVDMTVVLDEVQSFNISVDATIGSTVAVTASGFIADGSQTLDFNFDINGTVDGASFDLTGQLSMESPQAEIDADIQEASGTINNPHLTLGTIVFIPGTGFVIGFFTDFEDSSLDGSVAVGPDQVAYISEVGGDIELEPIEGSDASAEDLAGLELMAESLDAMFDGSLDILGLLFVVIGYSFL